MQDEAALRRLVSRLRQELSKLPDELKWFGQWKHLDHKHPDFDADDAQRSEYLARRAVENTVHLVNALLLSDPMLTDLHAAFKDALPSNLLDHKWGRDEYDDEYFDFPAQDAVERFFDLGISAVGGVISAERLEIVDAICAGLGEVVAEFVRLKWMSPPDRETPIRQLGFQLLKVAFPDAEPDGGITFKLTGGTSRKPDAAIPSLRLCVEFKFANDAAELSQRVDEIIADMSAYGDPRYDLFRAVVFAPYEDASQQRLDDLVRERMKNVHPRCEWKVFLAKATGGRARRSPQPTRGS